MEHSAKNPIENLIQNPVEHPAWECFACLWIIPQRSYNVSCRRIVQNTTLCNILLAIESFREPCRASGLFFLQRFLQIIVRKNPTENPIVHPVSASYRESYRASCMRALSRILCNMLPLNPLDNPIDHFAWESNRQSFRASCLKILWRILKNILARESHTESYR